MPLPTAPFNAAKSIYAGKKIIQVVLTTGSITGATASESSATITAAAHGFVVGDMVQFVSGTGFTGLTAGNNYFVTNAATGTFEVSATKGGTAITITTEGSAGVFAPVEVFESNTLKEGGQDTFDDFKRYGTDGIQRTKRKVLSESVNEISWEVDEAKRLLDIFGGRMNGLAVARGVTVWVQDPDDASGKCALKSTEFPANITRDGEVTMEKKVVATLKAENTGDTPITYTPDASTT